MRHLNAGLPARMRDWRPVEAATLEATRAEFLAYCKAHRYDLVHTPMVEHHSALSVGAGAQHDRSAFRFSDPVSGELLSVRTDISPQIARMDAALHTTDTMRYCYAGQVARAEAADRLAARNRYQLGAELFCMNDTKPDVRIEADIEILRLALGFFNNRATQPLMLAMHHAGLMQVYLARFDLKPREHVRVLDMLRRRSLPDIADWCASSTLSQAAQTAMQALFDCDGKSMADIAKCARAWLGESAAETLHAWQHVVDAIGHERCYFSLAYMDEAGYQTGYHTGLVFELYNGARLVCRGGRYDDLYEGRCAVGFSCWLDAV